MYVFNMMWYMIRNNNIFQRDKYNNYKYLVYNMFQVVFLLTTILKAVEPSVLATPTTASDTLNPAMELFNRSHSAYSLTNGNYLIGLYEFNYEDARDTSPAGMSNNNNNDNNNNDNNNTINSDAEK